LRGLMPVFGAHESDDCQSHPVGASRGLTSDDLPRVPHQGTGHKHPRLFYFAPRCSVHDLLDRPVPNRATSPARSAASRHTKRIMNPAAGNRSSHAPSSRDDVQESSAQ
jgi:hypothetical protein